jgi:hypothetical protein
MTNVNILIDVDHFSWHGKETQNRKSMDLLSAVQKWRVI